MGSVSAMRSTNRLAEVLAKLALPELVKQLVGRKIVDVELENEGCYEVRVSLKMDNGEFIQGPTLAEYTDGMGSDEAVDCCDIRSECPVTVKQIEKEYKKRGWGENL